MDYVIPSSANPFTFLGRSGPFTFLGAPAPNEMGAAFPSAPDQNVSAFQRQLNRFSGFLGFAPVAVSGKVDGYTSSALAALVAYILNAPSTEIDPVFYDVSSCGTYECIYTLVKGASFKLTAQLKTMADKLGLPGEIKPRRPKLFAALLGTGGLAVGAIAGVLIGRATK